VINSNKSLPPYFCLRFCLLLLSWGLATAHAQESSEETRLSILLRLQPELVSVSGSAARLRGTDGLTLTDGWSGGSKNSGNFGALFVDASQSISPSLSAFSRLGFNIDLNGLKDGDAKNRDLYIGIASPLGRLYAGRIAPAYKDAGIAWDPLNATFMQSRGNLGRSGGPFGHGGYLDRSLAYDHTFGPAKVKATISFDQTIPGDTTGSDDHAVSASVIIPRGAFELLAAYVDGSQYEGGAKERDALKLGVHYTSGPWVFGAMTESRGSGLEDGDIVYMTSSYRHEKWRFSTNLGVFEDNKGINDGTYFALGARYQFHKSISAHAGVRQIDRDVSVKETIAGIGLRFILNTGNLIR
jgi:predicted porin